MSLQSLVFYAHDEPLKIVPLLLFHSQNMVETLLCPSDIQNVTIFTLRFVMHHYTHPLPVVAIGVDAGYCYSSLQFAINFQLEALVEFGVFVIVNYLEAQTQLSAQLYHSLFLAHERLGFASLAGFSFMAYYHAVE